MLPLKEIHLKQSENIRNSLGSKTLVYRHSNPETQLLPQANVLHRTFSRASGCWLKGVENYWEMIQIAQKKVLRFSTLK
jgi:hypothetical protein